MTNQKKYGVIYLKKMIFPALLICLVGLTSAQPPQLQLICGGTQASSCEQFTGDPIACMQHYVELNGTYFQCTHPTNGINGIQSGNIGIDGTYTCFPFKDCVVAPTKPTPEIPAPEYPASSVPFAALLAAAGFAAIYAQKSQ